MSVNILTNPIPAAGITNRLAGWLIPGQQIRASDWTLEQLNILPYQHLLEIGYGSGKITQAVARKLKTGFIAGIDCSVAMYQQAQRRNRRYIDQQLLQLHVGHLHELPYPSQYFHTIYGTNIFMTWKDPQTELLRLSNLLKSGGRLVMILRTGWPRQEKLIRRIIENIQEEYLSAGLTDIRIRYKDADALTDIAVTGYKA